MHKTACITTVLLLSLLVGPAAAEQSAAGGDAAQTVVHMLDYIGVDYPEFVKDAKVLDQAEYGEQLEFAGQVSALLGSLPDSSAKATLTERAALLKTRIEAKASGTEVSKVSIPRQSRGL
jgi:high-affinity iron transporter